MIPSAILTTSQHSRCLLIGTSLLLVKLVLHQLYSFGTQRLLRRSKDSSSIRVQGEWTVLPYLLTELSLPWQIVMTSITSISSMLQVEWERVSQETLTKYSTSASQPNQEINLLQLLEQSILNSGTKT